MFSPDCSSCFPPAPVPCRAHGSAHLEKSLLHPFSSQYPEFWSTLPRECCRESGSMACAEVLLVALPAFHGHSMDTAPHGTGIPPPALPETQKPTFLLNPTRHNEVQETPGPSPHPDFPSWVGFPFLKGFPEPFPAAEPRAGILGWVGAPCPAPPRVPAAPGGLAE